MIYNQRFLRPQSRDLKKYIGNYVRYIAGNSISKVVFAKGEDHGLFGSVGSPKVKHIDDLNETIRYMQKKALKDKCILYHGFVSLSADEIKKADFQSRELWEQLISSKMSVIAKQNNIKIQNLEWIAAYHIKEDHSHCHLIFWDKSQQINEPFIPPNIFAKKMEIIKRAFARDVFKEDLKDLYDIKDLAFKNLSDELKSAFGGFGKIMADMTDEEMGKAQNMFSAATADYSDYDMINPHFSDKQIAIVAKEIMRIKSIIPKSGALKYGYMSEEVKTEIDKAVEKILGCNKACSRACHSYINSAIDIRKIYDDSLDSLDEAKIDATKVINKNIGNMLLKAIKELKNIEVNNSSQDFEQNKELYNREVAGDLLTKIAFALSRGSNSNTAKGGSLKNDELSKRAKKDLAKKLENKGIDWGQYER
jgi:hypothetical protein